MKITILKDGLIFVFEELVLQLHYFALKECKEAEEFVNSIFEILWERTEQNLGEIKHNINGQIKEEFFGLLSELDQELSELFGSTPQLLKTNITEARVNIENKLIKIANWFSITESNIADFNVQKLVDVSLASINKEISPDLVISCDCKFKGAILSFSCRLI